MGAEVIAVNCVAGAGRRSTGIAAEAANGTPRCRSVDLVVAGTERRGEPLGNDIEVGRAEQRLLRVAARDVVEERLIVGAYIRISHVRAGRRTDVGQATDLAGRRAGRQALVVPVDILADGVVFPEDPADAAQPPVVRGAQT